MVKNQAYHADCQGVVRMIVRPAKPTVSLAGNYPFVFSFAFWGLGMPPTMKKTEKNVGAGKKAKEWAKQPPRSKSYLVSFKLHYFEF